MRKRINLKAPPLSVARLWPSHDVILNVMHELVIFHRCRESAVPIHLGDVVGKIDFASDLSDVVNFLIAISLSGREDVNHEPPLCCAFV